MLNGKLRQNMDKKIVQLGCEGEIFLIYFFRLDVLHSSSSEFLGTVRHKLGI
jgi:hypothetical protein